MRHEQEKYLYSHTMHRLNSMLVASSSHILCNEGHCLRLNRLVSHILEAMER